MDEVRVYGCALTAGDITSLYNQSGATNPPPVNTPPTISDIVDRSIAANSNTGDIPFAVNDAETSPGSLSVTATSTNTTLVPNSNLLLGGSAGARTVRVTPAASLTGVTLITVTVSDGVFSTNDTFLVTVTNAPPPPPPTNTPPTISDITNRAIAADSNTGDVPFTVNDAQTSPGSLIVIATSGNTNLVPNANLVLGGGAGARTIRATPLPSLTGTSLITVTVSAGALSTNDTFLLTVTNAPPPPASGTNQLISRWQFDEASGNTALDFNSVNPGTLEIGRAHV